MQEARAKKVLTQNFKNFLVMPAKSYPAGSGCELIADRGFLSVVRFADGAELSLRSDSLKDEVA